MGHLPGLLLVIQGCATVVVVNGYMPFPSRFFVIGLNYYFDVAEISYYHSH
jgi:hypothetical protein